MASGSPYRSAPAQRRALTARVTFFSRPYLFAIPIFVALVIVAARAVPPKRSVATAWIGCANDGHVGRPKRETYTTPIVPCACETTHFSQGNLKKPSPLSCPVAPHKVKEYAEWSDGEGKMRIVLQQTDQEVTVEEAQRMLGVCRSDTPPGTCAFDFRFRFESVPSPSRLWILWVLLGVSAVSAVLFSSRVVVRVNEETFTVSIREASPVGQVRETSCALGQVKSIVDHHAGFAFLMADGTYVVLTESDTRPAFLRARTLAELEDMLVEARAAAEGARG